MLDMLVILHCGGVFQSCWFPAGILLRMDHETVLHMDILGFH